jgi:hypothetical protein
MRIKTISLCLVLSLVLSKQTFGQQGKSRLEWRNAVGMTLFMGDLGGSSGDGQAFIADLDFSTIRYSVGTGILVNITPHLALRADLNHAQLAADDAFSEDRARRARNLHFQSNLWEGCLSFEATLLNLFKRNRTGALGLYLFGGASGIYFNPKAEWNGAWYELQPLGTEGQGLRPNTELYSRFSTALVGGFGFRKGITNDIILGLELSLRKTFTDYLDDVSGTYYDYESLLSQRGEAAAELSYRGQGTNEAYPTGGMRGNPNQNDNFTFLQIVVVKQIGNNQLGRYKASGRKRFNSSSCPSFNEKRTKNWK